MEMSLWQKQSQLLQSANNEIALAIITGKIKNQFGLVKYYHKYHKDVSSSLSQKFNDLNDFYERFLDFAKQKDVESDTFLTKLNGFESSMAIKYWDYIRALLQDDNISFVTREHKGATDLFNCMLNYGYAILYARVWQALLSAGLNPYQSVIHHRHSGNPTLVYDLIEIFRSQAVDRVVISMIQLGSKLSVINGRLSEDTKKNLAKNIIARLNRYEYYHGVSIQFNSIINSQAQELAESIEFAKKFKPFVAKW